MKTDTISIVEAAYDCEGDARAWLRRLLQKAAPRLDRGFGVGASIYEPGGAPDRLPFASQYVDERLSGSLLRMGSIDPEGFRRANSSRVAMGTVTEELRMTAEEARSYPPFVECLHPFGIQDVIGVMAHDPSGRTVVLNAPTPNLQRPTRAERSAWIRIATHISAGARIHRAIGKLSKHDMTDGADAVLPRGAR